MYFNSISALAHKYFGDPLLPLCEIDYIDEYISTLAGILGWHHETSTKEERSLSMPEQDFILVASRDINRQLHCIYSWGQSRGEPFKPITTMKAKEKARTRDVGFVLSLPDHTHNQIAEAQDVARLTVREAKNIVQKYLNVTLLTYHRQYHHQGWWVKTTFARDPIVWGMLTEIYTKGEEVKVKAREIVARERGETEFVRVK